MERQVPLCFLMQSGSAIYGTARAGFAPQSSPFPPRICENQIARCSNYSEIKLLDELRQKTLSQR